MVKYGGHQDLQTSLTQTWHTCKHDSSCRASTCFWKPGAACSSTSRAGANSMRTACRAFSGSPCLVSATWWSQTPAKSAVGLPPHGNAKTKLARQVLASVCNSSQSILPTRWTHMRLQALWVEGITTMHVLYHSEGWATVPYSYCYH